MYDKTGKTVCWYCDIVKINQDDKNNKLVCEDLLLDVVVYDDGRIKVLDADELAEALEKVLIPKEYGILALRNMNSLLELIYDNKFIEIQRLMNKYE
jgi:predicted RNA-binding protein associated with RNAse of E/G family